MPCLGAYLLSNYGARYLLNKTFPLQTQIDASSAGFNGLRGHYYTNPPLAKQYLDSHQDTDSQINTELRSRPGRAPDHAITNCATLPANTSNPVALTSILGEFAPPYPPPTPPLPPRPPAMPPMPDSFKQAHNWRDLLNAQKPSGGEEAKPPHPQRHADGTGADRPDGGARRAAAAGGGGAAKGGGAAGGGKGEVDAAEVARLQTLVDELQQRLAEAKAASLGAPFDARGLVD